MTVWKFTSTLSKVTLTLAFKSIQKTYSHKSLHPWILNFICSMIRFQGFRIVKFRRVENSRCPPLLKISKLIKSSFSPEGLSIFGWNFVWHIILTLMLIGIKIKKNIAELGHHGCLKIYVDPKNQKKIKSTRAFKSISPNWLGIFDWNFVWSISRTLMFIVIKMKNKMLTELGHSDHLDIHINPSKIYVNPGI